MSEPDAAAEPALAVSATDVDVAGVSVEPDATPAELAAIVAAHAQLWPEPTPPGAATRPGRWRFSGRWWAKGRLQNR